MMKNEDILKRIETVAESDGRFKKEAFLFVLAALEFTIDRLKERRHLTGQELSRGIAEYAREQFGFMARTVLGSWGVTRTADFGSIVYLMIDEGLMSKTPEDSKEDFTDVYTFEEEFAWSNVRHEQFPERF